MSKQDSNRNVSVIIPTYNRCKIFYKVLKALEAQTIDKYRFEVVVVDDGSTDDTAQMVRDFAINSQLNIRYFFQENKKQGAARNLGIEHAEMPILIFIGDDTIPDIRFIESHLNFHQKLENPSKSSVIGYTTWHSEIKITPFMQYIGEFGHQFGYSLIDGHGPLRFNFYYTSNLLVPASLLKTLAHFFDEDFDVYGWEDIEFGYRLENIGAKLFLNRDAVAYHYHPVSVASFCRRQENVGRASNIFIKKHPELDWFLGDRAILERNAKPYLKAVFYKNIVNLLDNLSIPLSHDIYRFILDAHYAKAATLSSF
ncbi:MAG: glycosyltransferase [Desulfamplus sp.]|nr:glycosyltransferase [Desulfamplus sp.]